MTQERFIQLIDNPDLLATISYEELKTLTFAYPYAHNLRYLLALKADQEQHPDAARSLQTAAAYSLDRRKLFMLIVPKKLTPVRVAAPVREEVLQLKPIETVQRELEALAPLMREQAPPPNALELEIRPEDLITEQEPEPFPDVEPTPETMSEPVQVADYEPVIQPEPAREPETEPALGHETEPEPEISALNEPEPEPVPAPVVDAQPVAEPDILVVNEPGPVNIILQAPVVEVQAFVPEPPRQSFAEWFSQFRPPLLGQKIPPLPKKMPPRSKEKEEKESPVTGVAQTLAEKSVAENKSVISETLARLLVRQGYKEKAVDMYMRLSLAFPEKSAYFAAEIEKLKK